MTIQELKQLQREKINAEYPGAGCGWARIDDIKEPVPRPLPLEVLKEKYHQIIHSLQSI